MALTSSTDGDGDSGGATRAGLRQRPKGAGQGEGSALPEQSPAVSMEEKCLPREEEDDNKEEKAKKAEAAAGKPAWEVAAAVLLALALFFSIKGDGDFKGLETNGFGLFAATVPGSHWGNWRSLTRCDCKTYSHCLTDLPPLSLNTSYANAKALATCSLMHAMEDDDGACQIGRSAKQARLNIYRVFPWELYLRLEVAADFRPAIALGCYWILACTLLEIVLFLAMTTRQRWALARAQARHGVVFLAASEVLVWLLFAAQHEAVSYAAYRLYDSEYTTCTGPSMVFRDVFALYTLLLIFQRALGGGPSVHRQWEAKALERYHWLQDRPAYLHVLLDPRLGALHRYSGIDCKLMSDPVGVLTPLVNLLLRIYRFAWPKISAYINTPPAAKAEKVD